MPFSNAIKLHQTTPPREKTRPPGRRILLCVVASASPYWRRIQRALDHVAQHLEEPIHLQDLAKAAAFSEHHFHRIFRAVMDETVGEYITRQRLQTAALMLAYHHDLSVTTIGLACGYSSPSNSSKAFYKFFGVSPS